MINLVDIPLSILDSPSIIKRGTLEEAQKAEKVLPTPFANLVHITKTPFVQSIYDLEVSHMVFNNVVLLGEASFGPRSHTASGVSKAAYNAMKLAAAFDIVDQPIENLRMKLKE